MKRNVIALYIILILSLLLNIAYFKFDTFDYYLLPKLKKHFSYKTISEVNHTTEWLIFNKGLYMLKSQNSSMIYSEDQGLTNKLLGLKSSRKSPEFQIYNFPKSYLTYTLFSYAFKENNSEMVAEIIHEFDKLIDSEGKPLFNLNKVDQVPFALTSLELYKYTKEVKYLTFGHNIYNFIKSQMDENGIVCYRLNSKVYFYDTLGMIIPFLMVYYKVTKEDEVISLARHQIDYYITNNGINHINYMPIHGIRKADHVQVGSANWGRGIGWYFLALSYFHKETGEFEKEFKGLSKTLNGLRNSEGLWSQFPGTSNVFDASTTTMFIYSMKYVDLNLFPSKETLNCLKNYIAVDGAILQTSGDTYTLNNYSRSFGNSELSQGMLLLFLSVD
ncbi:glycoside hydrolase family 88 protein [Cognataquiflexum aquatile]|uniref:glycoside hydrolase family 88 protein n=1 Tax=Cognataquiflexum aquatile TaxID=2249427 RepID=UPI000DEBBE20|nr:glycoside hydrolase family 88 protein [Cognataquiflexum aquatile]